MTVDYTHILSFDPILYARSEATPPFPQYMGSRGPVLAAKYDAYRSDHPLYTPGPRLQQQLSANMHSRVHDDIICCNNGDVTMFALDALEAVNDKGGQGDPYFKKLEIGKCY